MQRPSKIINIDIKISKKCPINKNKISLKKNSKISLADNLNKLIKVHHNANNNKNNNNNKINHNNNNKQMITSFSNKNILIFSNSSKNTINTKNNICKINHSNSFTNLKDQNISVQSKYNHKNINNSLKDKYLKSKSISKFYLKNNITINKSKSKTKSKPKQIKIPKCNNNKKNIILNIKIGKKNNDSYSIDKTPLKNNNKIISKINNYYSHTQSYNNINKIKNGNTQSCININKEILFDKFNEKNKNKNNKIHNNINLQDFKYILNNKYLENSNIQNNNNIDTELNKYLVELNKEFQTFNGSITESPINVKNYTNNNKNKNKINYSDINCFYNNNFINNVSDNDIIKHFNNLSNYKNKKNMIPNNFIKNKYLLSTYDKIYNAFNNINSTRNSINVNVLQNINNNNNKNNLNKYNHLKYQSSQNIGNNPNLSFNKTLKLNKRNNNSSINIIKAKKRKNKSAEIIDKINFNIKNISISNNFIKEIENINLIKPTYQIKLDIIKRRTINMLEFYINLAKNAVDKSINNNHN